MKQLYFVRHGLSLLNQQGLLSGTLNTALSDEGREQAKLAGQTAKPLNIGLIVCSPLDRTMETARIIADQIGYDHQAIVVNDLLVERDFGEMEGKPYIAGSNYDEVPGAETIEMLMKRARVLAEQLNVLEAEVVLLVGHGSIGRALRSVYDPAADFLVRIPNGQVVQFLLNSDMP